MRSFFQWLRDLPGVILDDWREYRDEQRELAEAEFNREHPLHGPPDQLSFMIQGLWSDELLRQVMPPVLLFQQVDRMRNEDV